MCSSIGEMQRGVERDREIYRERVEERLRVKELLMCSLGFISAGEENA